MYSLANSGNLFRANLHSRYRGAFVEVEDSHRHSEMEGIDVQVNIALRIEARKSRTPKTDKSR